MEDSGYGCYIRGVFAGCVLYADDILLLFGSLLKLQAMLDICRDFGLLCDLTFNSKKSVCFVIGNLFEVAMKSSIFIGNGKLGWVNECNYLGVTVSSGKRFRTVCEERKRKFCAAANSIIVTSHLSEECSMYLLKTQCLPVLTYGAIVYGVVIMKSFDRLGCALIILLGRFLDIGCVNLLKTYYEGL